MTPMSDAEVCALAGIGLGQVGSIIVALINQRKLNQVHDLTNGMAARDRASSFTTGEASQRANTAAVAQAETDAKSHAQP